MASLQSADIRVRLEPVALRDICGRHSVTAAEIDKVAREKANMIALFDDAMGKVKEGITTVEEALRTVRVEKD